jgi:hypothetical protein
LASERLLENERGSLASPMEFACKEQFLSARAYKTGDETPLCHTGDKRRNEFAVEPWGLFMLSTAYFCSVPWVEKSRFVEEEPWPVSYRRAPGKRGKGQGWEESKRMWTGWRLGCPVRIFPWCHDHDSCQDGGSLLSRDVVSEHIL